METLTDNPDEKLYNGATTARQVYAQIDQMSLRGRSAFRSEEERTNRISLGSAPSRSKLFEPVVLYESSAKVRFDFFSHPSPLTDGKCLLVGAPHCSLCGPGEVGGG